MDRLRFALIVAHLLMGQSRRARFSRTNDAAARSGGWVRAVQQHALMTQQPLPNTIELTEEDLAAVSGGEYGMYAESGMSGAEAGAAYGEANAIMCGDGMFVGLFGGDWGFGMCFGGSSGRGDRLLSYSVY